MEVVASLSQGRTAAAQCGLFTYKSVPVKFEPPCNSKLYLEYKLMLSKRFLGVTSCNSANSLFIFGGTFYLRMQCVLH